MNPMLIAALIQAAPHLLQGFFGNSGDPSRNAGKEYFNYYNKAIGRQNPFYEAGTGALPKYQDWLDTQKDPSKFINDQMGKYSQSEWAKNLTHQATNAATNMASANGLSGSTPLAQQIAQNAGNIASADQNQWLQNVLGINTQYGAGEKGLIDTGQHSADQMSNLDQQQGKNAANASYGQTLGQNSDRNEILQAITQFLKTYNGGQGGGQYTGGPQYPKYLGY
jgi:hypothetical protein